jgi:predicted alpha/beta-fold hydrolase
MQEELTDFDFASFREHLERHSASKNSKGVVVNLNDHYQEQRDIKQNNMQKKTEAESGLGDEKETHDDNDDDDQQCEIKRATDTDSCSPTSTNTKTKTCTSSEEKAEALLLLLSNKKWIAGVAFASLILNESKRRKALTDLPLIYHQDTERNHRLHSLVSAIFLRKYKPSLFLGTRSMLNSVVAYMKPGPVAHNRMRETMTMSRDGAIIALDWEFPATCTTITDSSSFIDIEHHHQYILGKTRPITENIVLILHGVNTDSSFGYMRSLMNSCTNNNWIAIGMNARGSGKIDMTTPRFMNSAYTNDLRNVIQVLSSRQAPSANLFLIGFSMGANTLVKYLGECGAAGAAGGLPPNVIGAISFANPMHIHDANLRPPWSQILTIGAKKNMRHHTNTTKQMTCHHYQNATQKAASSTHLSDMTHHTAPYMIRNSTQYPFENSIGYANNEEYWKDSSSRNYITHISIPLLVCFANDDGIAETTMAAMNTCLSNPNVIIARTPCGGHMGWHCSNRLNPFGSWRFKSEKEVDKCWSDRVAVQFMRAVLNTNTTAKGEEMYNDANRSSSELDDWREMGRSDISHFARGLSSRLEAKL